MNVIDCNIIDIDSFLVHVLRSKKKNAFALIVLALPYKKAEFEASVIIAVAASANQVWSMENFNTCNALFLSQGRGTI